MIDKDLQNTYEKAVYRIFKPAISWKVGSFCPEIDELLNKHDVLVATYVTAHNPHSNLLPLAENERRSTLLRRTLEQQGYLYLEGQGEDPQGKWPAEASFLVLGMDENEAQLLGQQFGQNAVLIIPRGQAVRLLLCPG